MIRSIFIAFAVLLVGCEPSQPLESASVAVVDSRANILLVVVDDMGFTDLGSFGGEIPTPRLDKLAFEGIRFSNFHTASTCSPTRAMLLTGVDSHRAGLGNMLEELSPNQQGRPGYEGYLNDSVVTLPRLLQSHGYKTYMTGKWHLGTGEGKGAAYRGFDRSFVLDSGGASHFADMRPGYAPTPDVKANYWRGTDKLEELPAEFEYSTQYYADQMIEFLQDHDAEEQPFFAYLSYTAPHWPLQAPDEAVARHRGNYDVGFDVIAEQRLDKMKKLGLVSENTVRSGRSPKEKPWSELTDDERRFEIRAMEIYAAMIEEIDIHTGRVIDYLEESGMRDNTIIIFMSDNGAEGHDLDETWSMDLFPEIRKTIDASHDFSYEAMGKPGSYLLYGPNWANAGSPAFNLYKAFPSEGGTRVTAFVNYPQASLKPAIEDQFVYVTDVTPTVLELAGIEHPGSVFEGRSVEAVTGNSFAPLLRGEEWMAESDRVVGAELFGKRVIWSGDWKLVHMPQPYGVDEWQLFNIADDIGETKDISADNAEVATRLKSHWEEYAEDNNVIIPDWVSGY